MTLKSDGKEEYTLENVQLQKPKDNFVSITADKTAVTKEVNIIALLPLKY